MQAGSHGLEWPSSGRQGPTPARAYPRPDGRPHPRGYRGLASLGPCNSRTAPQLLDTSGLHDHVPALMWPGDGHPEGFAPGPPTAGLDDTRVLTRPGHLSSAGDIPSIPFSILGSRVCGQVEC